ncbi:hypothetical protein CTI12_AA496580 [Artemisia annua]|uniref:Uncharacterized protein n=1 Tax=Artemisia annua TaxID=35608 RepID=A0A2U1LF19_ARTAN|nr:hypothetical protein CTI12_AA496580 [Artemisia annua]
MKSELSWFHSLFVGVPDSMKQEFNDSAEVIGSSHGLLCVHIRNTGLFLLSNPCIRKVVSLQLPDYRFRDNFLGFAICPVTNDPTIVMILSSWQVGIFTLSSKRFTFSQHTRLHPRRVQVMSFSPVGSNIWFKLYGPPSDRDVDLIGSVIQSWYVMGRLGAYNSSNLQLANTSMEYNPLYDADKGFNVMPSSFHDVGDVEFQDNWGRVWVDIGTFDYFALDVLLNCLTVLSSEYLGIQQVVFGGRSMGAWEEGMKNPEDGYNSFKILDWYDPQSSSVEAESGPRSGQKV